MAKCTTAQVHCDHRYGTRQRDVLLERCKTFRLKTTREFSSDFAEFRFSGQE